MNRHVLKWIVLYGAGLAALTSLMVWVRYSFLVLNHALELYSLLIGIIFVGLGIWMGLKLSRPKTIVQTETVIREVVVQVPAANAAAVVTDPSDYNISQREYEVLQLLARGMSNQEIAGSMFVSENTIKTHLSNLYFKLDVKRRTQAVEKARSVGLIG
jgi:DNA-binding CsgD family transcriptional regulator